MWIKPENWQFDDLYLKWWYLWYINFTFIVFNYLTHAWERGTYKIDNFYDHLFPSENKAAFPWSIYLIIYFLLYKVGCDK